MLDIDKAKELFKKIKTFKFQNKTDNYHSYRTWTENRMIKILDEFPNGYGIKWIFDKSRCYYNIKIDGEWVVIVDEADINKVKWKSYFDHIYDTFPSSVLASSIIRAIADNNAEFECPFIFHEGDNKAEIIKETLNEGFYKNVGADMSKAKKWFTGYFISYMKQIPKFASELACAVMIKSIIESIPDGFGFSYEIGIGGRRVYYKKENNLYRVIYNRKNKKGFEYQLYHDIIDISVMSNELLRDFYLKSQSETKHALDSLQLTVEKDIVNFD